MVTKKEKSKGKEKTKKEPKKKKNHVKVAIGLLWSTSGNFLFSIFFSLVFS